jgi:uncharacterized protein YyaL (SSP411 family)
MAAINGFRLSRLTGNPDFEDESDQILRAFSEVIGDNPSAYTFALITKLNLDHNPIEIAVTGDAEDGDTQAILDYLSQLNRFQHSVLFKTDETEKVLNGTSPFTKSFSLEKKPRVYICRNFTCDAPVSTLSELKMALEKS